ncbi:TIGR03752 family integrating conjugative element protein [Endothiovibrio diazotrophicus]
MPRRINPLLVLLLVGLLIAVIAVYLRAGGEPGRATAVAAGSGDGDTIAETIRALSAQMTETAAERDAERERRRAMERKLEALQQQVDAVRQPPETTPAENPGLDALKERLAFLEAYLPPHGDAPATPTGRVEMDFGLNGAQPPGERDAAGYLWIEGDDGPSFGKRARDAVGGLLTSAPDPSGAGLLESGGNSLVRTANGLGAELGVTPVYTLPANSTLMGATAWTALIGRIPRNGRVEDPYRVKILTGRDNLAANGHRLPPALRGMVWAGVARGDLNLSCVAADLTSVTFLFDDGTVRTVRAKEERPLGVIQDRFGAPCIPGELITDAPRFLALRLLGAGAEAAADAFAEGQTRTTDGAAGSRTEVAAPLDYAVGRGVAGGTADARQWLTERQGQSFDVIHAPAGTPVTIDVIEEIAIDYDPNGRRIDHGFTDPPRLPARLD